MRHFICCWTVFSVLVAPLARANPPADPAGPGSVRPWMQSAQATPAQIAADLGKTLEGLPGSPEDYGVFFVHLSDATEDPRVLEAAALLRSQGLTVGGTLVTPEQMQARLIEAVEGASPVLAALDLKLPRASILSGLKRFTSKLRNITFWTHFKKWKDQDFNGTSWKAIATNQVMSLIAASVATGWFFWASYDQEAAFAQTLGEASAQLQSAEGLGEVLQSGLTAASSLGDLSPLGMAASGAIFLWVLGYQNLFTAINSFRRQWTTPFFDPSAPAGSQLVLDNERAYSRLFFFASSVGIETIICTLMLALFNGGHLNMTLMLGGLWTSICSAMAYMPAETWAGTLNERAAQASRLASERREQQAGLADETTRALEAAAPANKQMEWTVRQIWWNLLYPPMRNSHLFGLGSFGAQILSWGFVGFFGLGTTVDGYHSRSRLKRGWQNLLRRFTKRDPAHSGATCTDLVEIRALREAEQTPYADTPFMGWGKHK